MKNRMEPTRERLLDTLSKISKEYPDMRLGQLISNLCSMQSEDGSENIWDIEDEDLELAAQKLLASFEARQLQMA